MAAPLYPEMNSHYIYASASVTVNSSYPKEMYDGFAISIT
jgi:hypothetical protein